jgi:hypothetical protein
MGWADLLMPTAKLRVERLFGSGWDPDRVFLAGPSPDLASGEIVGTATACFAPRAHGGTSVREHRVVAPGHGPLPNPCDGSAALAQAVEVSKPPQPVPIGSAVREAEKGAAKLDTPSRFPGRTRRV